MEINQDDVSTICVALDFLRARADSLRNGIDKGYIHDQDVYTVRNAADVICCEADRIECAIFGENGRPHGDPNSPLAKMFRSVGVEIFKGNE